VVSAPGREPREYEATLKPRENQTLTVEPGAEVKVAKVEAAPERWSEERAAPVAATAPTRPALQRKTPVLGWVLLGGGAVALGGAGYFGLQALSARKDAKQFCPGPAPRVCREEAREPLDRDRRNSLLADISAGAGAVLAAAGLYLVLRTPRETTTAQLAPLPGGGAFQLAGRF
jgi:hypothetical protein